MDRADWADMVESSLDHRAKIMEPDGLVRLAFELELSREEAQRLERFMDEGCYDSKKLIKRWILDKIGAPDRAPGGA